MKNFKIFIGLLFAVQLCLSQTPCQNGFAGVYPCNDYDLMSHITLSQMSAGAGNDSWGWTDPLNGNEYALIGLNNGTAFINISDPVNPVYLGKLPTATTNSSWRDVKVYNNHAFIVSEAANHGMQVFDLTRLRNVGNPPQTFTSDALYNGFGNAHNIIINENTGYAYAVGTSTFNGGPHFVNIQNPTNPLAAGGYNIDGYSHDAQIVTYNGPDSDYTGREIMFGSNEDEIVIVDITDKANPTPISTISYTNVEYTHQGWFTENQRFFILGDELDEQNIGFNTRTIIFDFQDLDNPTQHMTYTGPSPAIDHNGYVKGDLFYLANYRAGVRIVDITNIGSQNISEVGYFDTYPSSNSAAFNGVWNVYPFFNSGNIIISDIEGGFFLIKKSAAVVCNATTPSGLSASGITSSAATLNWNLVSNTTYDLRYRETGASTWNNLTIATNTSNLTGLASQTQYEAQVRSKCPDNSTSTYSTSINFTTLVATVVYCNSASTNVNDEYISRVQLGTIDNASGAQYYSDFTSISADLTEGQTYTITVTPTWTGSVYAEGYAAWIDYNNDGDFIDAGEQVWTKAASTNTPNSGSFTVPNGTVATATRMRVSMKYNAIPTACESFTYGEVEDYTVNLGAGVPDTQAPSIPTSLAASNVTQTTVDLSWNASSDNVGVTGYDIYQGSTNLGTVSGTSEQITGLTAATVYSFRVRARDAAGNISGYSNTVNLTTTAGGGGNGCVGGISSFPYTESFESGLGAWTQSTTDDINWTRDSGGTPSSNTGPTSGSQGSWYMYVEASSPNYPSKRAILNSPCFNLSAETAATFSFSYHMYGAADMGSIALEVSADNGATWTSLWSQTGNKGNSWLTANLDLSAYVGESVQLRFNRLTGSTWQADIAIDNVNLSTGGGGNTGCSGGVSLPYAESFESSIGAWTQSISDDINWTRNSGGTPSSNTGPSSGSPGSWYMFVEASGNGTGYPNKSAILNSPCVDLSSGATTFNFNYHMYGAADMGSIALEASGDNGASWTSLWSQTGNKGNSWLSASVDLSAYAGGGVQLRFSRVTGSTWQADIAVDNISINTASPLQGTNGNSPNSFGIVTLSIYPNPVNGAVLNAQLKGATATDYVIYNMIGQVVNRGAFTNRINVSTLGSGVYLIEVNAGDEKYVDRFIKK